MGILARGLMIDVVSFRHRESHSRVGGDLKSFGKGGGAVEKLHLPLAGDVVAEYEGNTLLNDWPHCRRYNKVHVCISKTTSVKLSKLERQ